MQHRLTSSERVPKSNCDWRTAAMGARAADELLAVIAPERVRKAVDPLSKEGFDQIIRALALQLLSEVERPETAAVNAVEKALDKNWPRLSAAERERAIKQAEAIVGRISSTVVPPLRKVLRDSGKKIVDSTKGAAISKFELPIAAVFGAQDERIIEHAANAQGLYVTDYYGNRSAVLGQRARDIVAKGLEDGLDQYEIGKQLETAIGASLGRSSSYYPVVASIFAARSRSWSVLSSFEDAEIESWQFSSVLDEHTCFAKGTRVLMGDGKTQKAIDEVRVGEFVMSCKGRPQTVLGTIRAPVRKWGEVVFADPSVGPLLVTRSHGLLTSRGWIRAQVLTASDSVAMYVPSGPSAASTLWGGEREWGGRRGRHDPRAISAAPWPHPLLDRLGRFAAITSIVWTETGRTEDAYDLEVEEDSGYIAENVIVHNSHICRFMDGQVFSVKAATDRYRKVAESPPEAIKQLQPFVREKRDKDGKTVLYVGEDQRFEIARVEDSAMGRRDDRGSFSSQASPKDLEAQGVSAPPLHGHCRSDLIPV